MVKPAHTIVILSDQHHAKFMGLAGHPLVKTPNLDRLAARGTYFPSAYTPCPICVPARASFATGEWVHDIGYWDNATAYDGRVESWGHRLAEKGIPSVAVGKLHYRNNEDDVGFDEQIIPMHIAEGVGQVWGLVRDPLPVRPNGELMVAMAGPGTSKYNTYDMAVAERAAKWLREHSDDEKPWVLYVGFVAPHFPYVVPQEYFDLYPLESLSRAVPHPDTGWQPHPWIKEFLDVVPGIDSNSDEERLRCTAAYMGLCTFLDANIGKVLDALVDTGLAARTRVVYSSDHGDQVGSRHHWGKSMPYEPSVAVPMIVAGPDIPSGKVCRTPVNLVDLYPTILQSAGVAVAESKPGRSLIDIAAAADDPERIQFSEYHAYGAPSAWYMVRRGQYKYVYYVGYAPELFDLEADPMEIRNLAGQPSFAEVEKALRKELFSMLDPEVVDAAAKASQKIMVEKFGGRAAALAMGTPAETPTPF